MDNSVLEAIKKRRTIREFKDEPVEEEKLEKILEAGRWAPSSHNSQPWKFVIIRDSETKDKISEFVPNWLSGGVKNAPINIAICVNPEDSPLHHVEDGAIAAQNMALAAHSLGLGTSWIGVYDPKNRKDFSEAKIKKILNLPEDWRIIAVLPVSVPKSAPEKDRKELSEMVYETDDF